MFNSETFPLSQVHTEFGSLFFSHWRYSILTLRFCHCRFVNLPMHVHHQPPSSQRRYLSYQSLLQPRLTMGAVRQQLQAGTAPLIPSKASKAAFLTSTLLQKSSKDQPGKLDSPLEHLWLDPSFSSMGKPTTGALDTSFYVFLASRAAEHTAAPTRPPTVEGRIPWSSPDGALRGGRWQQQGWQRGSRVAELPHHLHLPLWLQPTLPQRLARAVQDCH